MDRTPHDDGLGGPGGVSARQRILAVAALAAGVGLVVVVVVLSARNAIFLVGAVIGMAAMAAGAWWVITEQQARRLIGVAGIVLGLGVIVIAAIVETSDGERPVALLALVVVLLALAVACGRAALERDLHERDDRRPTGSNRRSARC